MLKEHYKALNYIRRKNKVTETELYQKFPEFKDYSCKISSFYNKEDNNAKIYSEIEEKLVLKTSELNMTMAESSEYIHTHMPELKHNSDLVTYQVSDNFLEFYEQKREKLLLFWLPYSITTLIAIASLIAQFLPYFMGQ